MMHLHDSLEDGLEFSLGNLEVEGGVEGFQGEAEDVDDLEEFVDGFSLNVEGRLVESLDAGLLSQKRGIEDEFVPDDRVVVGPGNDPAAGVEGGLNDLFGRVVPDDPFVEVLDLRGFPVLAEVAGHHATDVAEAEDAGAGGVVVDCFSLDVFEGGADGDAVVEGVQGTIGLSADAAEPILAFDHLAVARAEIALDPARFAGGFPVAGRMSWCFEMHDRKLGK